MLSEDDEPIHMENVLENTAKVMEEDGYYDIVKSKEVLLEYIEKNMLGFKLYNIKGNGLCVVNSFRKNMEVVMNIYLQNETLLAALITN